MTNRKILTFCSPSCCSGRLFALKVVPHRRHRRLYESETELNRHRNDSCCDFHHQIGIVQPMAEKLTTFGRLKSNGKKLNIIPSRLNSVLRLSSVWAHGPRNQNNLDWFLGIFRIVRSTLGDLVILRKNLVSHVTVCVSRQSGNRKSKVRSALTSSLFQFHFYLRGQFLSKFSPFSNVWIFRTYYETANFAGHIRTSRILKQRKP